MNKLEKQISKILSYVLLIVVIGMIVFMNTYSQLNKNALGLILIFISIMLLIKYRQDKFYILMFGIILYANLTIAASDCFSNATITLPINTLTWQKLRGTYNEIVYLKALVLFMSIINFIGDYDELSFREDRKLENKDNIIVFIFGCSLLLYGLITGYGSRISNMTGYISNTSSMFEYCLLFFLLTWYYSGKSKIRNGILIIYSVSYISTALLHGDRSSAFPMIILLVILYRKRITIKQLLLYIIFGVFVSNLIAAYRNSLSFNNLWQVFMSNYGIKRIYSDTVSHAYYTGVSICYVREYLGNTDKYFGDFLIGIILGGDYGEADVTGFCREYSMNKGGGMCPANFYFWFGYFGVTALAFFVGFINRKIRLCNSNYGLIMKIYYCISVFRWYIYTSFDLFRGVFFVLPVSYFIFMCIDSLSHKSFKIKIRSIDGCIINENILEDEP